MNTLVQVQFHTDTLWAVEQDGAVLIAIKPICENLSMDWSAQYRRILRDQLLSEGVAITATPSPGGSQETMCLPLDLIPGWLFGIDDRRIRDEAIRVKVLEYKRHCYRVLYEHFFGQSAASDTEEEAQRILMPGHPDFGQAVRLVREARMCRGANAALAIWKQIGLPWSPELEQQIEAKTANEGDAVARFALEAIEKTPGIITTPETLWLAFAVWCEAEGIHNFGKKSFQTRFGRLGFAKRKSGGRVFYIGIRPNISEKRDII